jgi:hypothetical protein
VTIPVLPLWFPDWTAQRLGQQAGEAPWDLMIVRLEFETTECRERNSPLHRADRRRRGECSGDHAGDDDRSEGIPKPTRSDSSAPGCDVSGNSLCASSISAKGEAQVTLIKV